MKKKPSRAAKSLDLAWAAFQENRTADVVRHCDDAISADPRLAKAHHLKGVALARTGQALAAIGCYQAALRFEPHNADLHACLAASCLDDGDLIGAEAAIEAALRLDDSHTAALNNLGNLRLRQSRPEDALRAFDRVLVRMPQHANALKALGGLLLDFGRFEEARQILARAASVMPLDLAVWRMLAQAGHGDFRLPGMPAAIRHAIERDPENLDLRKLLLVCLKQLERYSEALKALEAVPEPHRRDPDITGIVAGIWCGVGRPEAAVEYLRSFERESLLDGDDYGDLLFYLNYVDTVSARECAEEHALWGNLTARRAICETPVEFCAPDAGRRLRLGFVSGDFRRHAVAVFLQPILEQLDRQQFHITCYQTSPISDDVTAQLKRLADEWRIVPPTSTFPDAELSKMIIANQIDVLVDLSGHTGHTRISAFAFRSAPVQASYLGYPSTSGLTTIDYRITDDRADPSDQTYWGTETLIRLPDCFHCYRGDETLPVHQHAPPRESGRVTFGSFNNLPKITDTTVAAWAAVLHELPHADLFIKTHGLEDPYAREVLFGRFARHGIGPERLQLMARVEGQSAHMALYQQVDIALDTFPYNGTTTTCEALWMGVPVITLVGDRHAGRVGCSLLTAAGHPELIAASERDFVQLAVALAQSPLRLAAYHRGLREELRKSPLMDAKRFTRNFEDALRTMWLNYCAAAKSS